MDKQGWFQQELKTVQEELEKWPKWKLGKTESEEKEPTRPSKQQGKAAAPKRE